MDVGLIRVVIVEDHAMVAESLAVALGSQPDITIAAVVGTLREGHAAAAREQPEVVLMDYRLPDGRAIESVPAILESAPDTRVLLITAEPPERVAGPAIASGCAGLVPKGERVQDVVAAIRAVHGGETVYDADVLLETMRSDRDAGGDPGGLTARELEILELLALGAHTAEIAERLVLSPHTVRNHVRNLTAKLGVHSRLEAVARARQRGLLDNSDD